jgi:hypothetical protein
MNLTFIEYRPQKVLAAFREGEFDGLEVIGQAVERDFFQRAFQERLLSMTARVPPKALRSLAPGQGRPMYNRTRSRRRVQRDRPPYRTGRLK